jgi:hypothetical protein
VLLGTPLCKIQSHKKHLIKSGFEQGRPSGRPQSRSEITGALAPQGFNQSLSKSFHDRSPITLCSGLPHSSSSLCHCKEQAFRAINTFPSCISPAAQLCSFPYR